MNTHESFDVVIIGAGPAGSSTARYAAELGLKTVLLDKRALPRFKACGGALSSRNIPLLGQHALNAINCDVQELRLYSPTFNRFSYRNVEGHFVIREDFDFAMVADARDAGAIVMEDCAVSAVETGGGGLYEISTSRGILRANYVVAASGYAHQPFLKNLGIPRLQQQEKDYMAACFVSETPVDNGVLAETGLDRHILAIFFGAVPNGYGWVFVKDGFLNIGIGATAVLLKDVGAMRAYNLFLDNLRRRGIIPPDLELGAGVGCPLPFKHTAERTVFGKLLLVGDAAGFVSPLSGEGLYYSIKGGQLAAEAIFRHKENSTPLPAYEDAWRREFGNDLNKYGYFMRTQIYKSSRRMELAVALGKKDPHLALILNKMLYGLYNYKQTLVRSLARLPVSLMKAVFK
jgi:geranylgeranyl reductase family protein